MTDTLTWSFGAIKRREADVWQRDVGFEKPDEFLRRIVVRGFDGLLIDSRGFPARKADPNKSEPVSVVNPRDRIHAIFADLVKQKAALLPEVIHEDGQQFFLDLRPYRDAYLRVVGPDNFEAQAKIEREKITPLWLKGFTVFDPIDDREQLHWGTYDATLVFVNPTDRTRTIGRLSFTLGIEVAGEFRFSLSGLATREFELEKWPGENEQDRSRQTRFVHLDDVAVPPGRTTLHFRCTPPRSFIPADHRKLCYFIKDFKFVEK